MIGFEATEQPPGFFRRVEKPGRAWLKQNSAGRPKDLWSPFKPQLADAFHKLCAYSAMYEPVGTVDHFVSLSENRNLAYSWSNYRYAAGWINSSKSNLPSTLLLDPFEVRHGWFEISLPSLQLVTSDGLPEDFRERANFVLKRLHLQHDERVLRQRQEWYRMFVDGELTLEGLRKKAPLIASAVDKLQDAKVSKT